MRKLLIANRGEIAVRIGRAARALGIATVAVHSEADATALHVTSADEAVAIGPARPAQSYLVVEAIIAAAQATGADAIHPGYGFLAENAGFAQAVEAAGLIFVGPTPAQIAMMGDKGRAREAAEAAGVPVLPASGRIAPGAFDGLAEAGARVGFPLLVKAVAGGGGIGMRLVAKSEDLLPAVEALQSMAARAFGDGTAYLERYVAAARHVEVQVFGLGDGRAVHLFERECSVQRRFQKIVEESPSPGITPETRAAMCQAAQALAAAVGYRSAGTIEFVVDDETGAFYFLEMNTRIQVEHPVTEMITGVDLVQAQLRLAQGEDCSAVLDGLTAQGHAIECRLCAENPERMFLPSPGKITRLVLPEAAGLRIDTGVREGDTVTPFYDSLLAKIIVHAADRPSAIAGMQAALGALTIEGIITNREFLLRLLAHPAFMAGQTLTGFIDTHRAALFPPKTGETSA
ncbi:acetyl-CoA carboxylase biotin carboxylase subunit [Acidisoma cellulosilytica]|uniref:Acetyl-CoA carboxylase biotin carboxylase subunit n=1 Tax=Acidisoma cellulosilyticum TaxID=2802395 RepID=A0A963Z3G9_9PROT|nr:biotin carboxylase N-terminal domain-containing protein [Acidisoma cellulosilyticum]MCB8881292.1 acetyl-CoA carboxylase biotin carboxylase subunit [Acidisoma cellulosilyticum]